MRSGVHLGNYERKTAPASISEPGATVFRGRIKRSAVARVGLREG